ncbi:MAG: ATP-binding protein [Ilumatobacteraceae bacterium]
MSHESDTAAHDSSRTVRRFPFSAVVGQHDAKLALLLAAVDPLIGGVLLRGHKGSAKTTLARGLAGLVGGFTDLPLGTTEDRLLGSLDVGAALAGGAMTFRPGLLAAADGGVLYVDEVNLLADHLVDVLLDVAVSGEQIVERDGISHRHPARFVLVGSMNPEEGELRPQLVDRFGLCVEVRATDDVAERMQAVRRRLAHDTLAGGASFAAAEGRAVETPAAGAAGMLPAEVDVAGGHLAVRGAVAGDAAFAAADAELGERLRRAQPAVIGDDVLEAASRLALAVGAEGLRADLTLCRAAAACAGLDGRAVATLDDLRRVAPLVLAHRARRRPHDPPVVPPDQLADAIDQTLGDTRRRCRRGTKRAVGFRR